MRATTRNLVRKVWYGGWIFVASFLIMLALAFSAIRLMLPLATDYKADIEGLASRLLGYPARIERIDTDWHWFKPRLKLLGVSLQDKTGGSSVFAAEEVVLAMNPFSSIVKRRIEIDELTVVRTDFSLSRDAAGRISARGFALPAAVEGGDAGVAPVPPFLLDRTLRVIDSVVTFEDAASGINYRLDAVNLALRLGRQEHRVYLSVSLPEAIGERFEAGAELRGDLRNLHGLQGRVYLQAVGLDVPAALQKTAYRDSVASGRVDCALWVELSDDARRELQGNINLRDFAGDFAGLPVLAGFRPFDRISADLRGRLAGDALELELENLLLAVGEDASPLNGLALRTSVAGPARFSSGEIMIDNLRLRDAWAAIAHYPPLREALDTAGVRGIAGNLLQFYGRWNLEGGRRDIELDTRFEELGISGTGNMPGVSALRGTARVLDGRAVADFETVGSEFEYPRLFRNKLTLNRLNGQVFAGYSGSGLTLAARDLFLQTPHIVSRHWFDIALAPGRAPYADIYSIYEDGDVKAAGQYYPVTVMKNNLVSWLDEAVIAGRLVAGDLELRGPLDKFPFRRNEGVFRIDTDFDGMELNYFRDWPHLKEARLHTKFNAATLAIALHEGRISGTDISGADVWLTDFRKSRLIARVPVYGPLTGTVDYLRSSGLRERLDPLIDQVAAAGMQSGLVRLDIPLHRNADTRWSFTTSLFDGSLAFPGGLTFADINGRIRMDHESIDAEPFTAGLNGHPLGIDIATYAEESGNTARIAVAGEVVPADFLPRNGFDAAAYIKGAAMLKAAIDLPLTGNAERARHPSINLRLDAGATNVDLPAPFAKQAGVAAVLAAHAEFRDRYVLCDVEYGGWLEGRLRFQSGAIERAGIHLNESGHGLPEAPGVFITGRVGELNIDHWLGLRGAGVAAVSPLRRLELKVHRLTYLQRTLDDAVLQLTQQAQDWLVAVESELLSGSAAIPKQQGAPRPKLAFELKHFDIDRLLSRVRAPGKQPLPGDIPAFRLRGDSIVLNGWNLRQVELDADVDAAAQSLYASLRIGDPDVGLAGTAEWSADKNGAHRTEISLAFDSKNVGRGLGKFGYAEVIRDGTGTAKFDLAWSAPPQGFDLRLIQGEAEISLKDGQVLDIEPGGGRLFGLLSVQTIPRRLAFDFKDLFFEGFRFDKMKGRFKFAEGNAHTDNYYIDGPVGRIDITGRVGMVQRDYDQRILFRPDLSSSLPIVGTLLGGTGTGVALIMVDRIARLFGKQTDDLARLEYTLTGSWEDPVMTPVRQPRKKAKDK